MVFVIIAGHIKNKFLGDDKLIASNKNNRILYGLSVGKIVVMVYIVV